MWASSMTGKDTKPVLNYFYVEQNRSIPGVILLVAQPLSTTIGHWTCFGVKRDHSGLKYQALTFDLPNLPKLIVNFRKDFRTNTNQNVYSSSK